MPLKEFDLRLTPVQEKYLREYEARTKGVLEYALAQQCLGSSRIVYDDGETDTQECTQVYTDGHRWWKVFVYMGYAIAWQRFGLEHRIVCHNGDAIVCTRMW